MSEELQDMNKAAPIREVRFPLPNVGELDQHEEWCVAVDTAGVERKIRFHDYHQIFEIPGLYEDLFYRRLRCKSPATVSALLEVEAQHEEVPMSKLRALDVGAGNGIVAEELRLRGVEEIVGIDIIPEARDAALRDRPSAYDEYHVADLTALPEPVKRDLSGRCLNCLVSVAALGFGDIPPEAFSAAYNFIEEEGFIAFNLRDKFLHDQDDSGFSRLVRRLIDEERLEIEQQSVYCHRLSSLGERLNYVAMVGRKKADVPESWF